MREYLKNKLLHCKIIVVKTYSRYLYERYLADVYYTTGSMTAERVCEGGRFLNQEMIDEGIVAKY